MEEDSADLNDDMILTDAINIPPPNPTIKKVKIEESDEESDDEPAMADIISDDEMEAGSSFWIN